MSVGDPLGLLDELLDLAPTERAARLQQIAQADPALAETLARWLDADARGDPRVDRGPLATVLLAQASSSGVAAGDRIGAYALQQRLGRGGMGEVWLACRIDGQFEQQVALKLVRHDGSLADAEARFRRERDILAALDHPHIARLLDGGTLPDGRAWFALERIDGDTITGWCDTRRASVERRLHLLLQVCAAVQHAHSHLVVHRDLKPDNVLVDAAGNTKLLDFGIAKVLQADGAGVDTRLMTLEYAAPEQLRGGAVTTATDVHALGLLLFELMAGEHPFHDTGPAPFEIARAIVERQPPRLSSRVATRPQRAELLGLAPRRLRERLRGDLDAIVNRCLEKDPARRYGSPAALADDIERHLQRRPVSARSGGAYRAVRFIQRHALAAMAVSVVLVSLIAAVVVSRREAARANREAERAQHEAATATAVKDFLLDTFRSADPYQTGGRTVTARELLEGGAAGVDAALPDAPRVRAEVHAAFGDTFVKLDRLGEAQASYDKALAIYRELGLAATPAAVEIEVGLLTARYEAAVFDGLDRDIAALLDRLNPEDAELAASRLEVGSLLVLTLWSQGRYEEAAAAGRRFVDEAERVRGGESSAAGFAWYTLALIEVDRGRWLDAARDIERVVAIDRALLEPAHPGLVTDLQLIARVLPELGEPGRALPIAHAAHAARLAHFGPDHRMTIAALARVAAIEAALGQTTPAADHFQAADAQLRRLLGDDHDDVAGLRESYAAFLASAGQHDLARTHYSAAAAVWRRIGGEQHPRALADEAAILGLLEEPEHRLATRPRLETITVIQRQRDDAGLPASLATLARWSELASDAELAKTLVAERQIVLARRGRSADGTAAAGRLTRLAESIIAARDAVAPEGPK